MAEQQTAPGGIPSHHHPTPYAHVGTADPSAGAGVSAPVSALYHRNNAGVGELWVKTGAADTAWTK